MDNKTRFLIDKTYLNTSVEYGDTRLIQIGRRYCGNGEIIIAHTHENYYELTIITGGKGTIISNGENYSVSAGDIHLSLPCDIHEIRASNELGLEYDFFSFYTLNENFKSELKEISSKLFASANRVFQDGNIVSLIASSIYEFSNRKSYSNEIITSAFNQIIIYLIRAFTQIQRRPLNLSEAEILCYQVMQYVDTHVFTLKNLENVAKKFNYNYSYLSALFKKTTGKTLFEYFQSRKLETAKILLIENKKKISEISEMLNYSSPFAFSKAFKSKYKCSPREIKNTKSTDL